MQAPSVQRLLRAIVEDLCSGRSTIVATPDGVAPSLIWHEVERELSQQRWLSRELDVSGSPNQTPFIVLEQGLTLALSTPRTPRTAAAAQQLIRQNHDAPYVICLSGFEELSRDVIGGWLRFISDWKDASSSVEVVDQAPVVLCVMLPAAVMPGLDIVPIQTDAFLEIHEWFAVPSVLEVQLLVRADTDRFRLSTSGLWREHLLPSLAGGDVHLVDALWDAILDDDEQLYFALEAYAATRGWDTNVAIPMSGTTSRIVSAPHPATLPDDWWCLWQTGAAHWTPEYGLEVNAGLLAVHRRTDELKHRCWRGQASLLLPMLDHLRLAVCRQFADWFGSHWATRWCEPRDYEEAFQVRMNPMASQWGHLAQISRKGVSQRKACQQLDPFIEDARELRNRIAHYRPITFAEFNAFEAHTERIRRADLLT